MESADSSLSDTNNNNDTDETSQTTLVQEYPFLRLPPDVPAYLLSDQVFQPKADLMERMTAECGFSESAAKKSLYWTGNQSLFSALEWLCDRSQSTYETPLEDEVSQLRSEFERRSEEVDPLTLEEVTESDEDEGEKMDLALILNSCVMRRYSTTAWAQFIEETAEDMIYQVSLTTAGSEGLTSWSRSREEVLIGLAESSQHLVDLQLCARSLSLHTELSGLVCTTERPDLMDHMVLAVWGSGAEVELVVGGLIRSF